VTLTSSLPPSLSYLYLPPHHPLASLTSPPILSHPPPTTPCIDSHLPVSLPTPPIYAVGAGAPFQFKKDFPLDLIPDDCSPCPPVLRLMSFPTRLVFESREVPPHCAWGRGPDTFFFLSSPPHDPGLSAPVYHLPAFDAISAPILSHRGPGCFPRPRLTNKEPPVPSSRFVETSQFVPFFPA